MTRFLHEVAVKRNPRTSATVDQLLTRCLEQFDDAPNTLTNYRGYVRDHVSPLIGHANVGELDADVLDSFYAELRRCRQHCSGRSGNRHWTTQTHPCDARCTRPHVCKPLGSSSIRRIHFLLSGAYERAVRWRWVGSTRWARQVPQPRRSRTRSLVGRSGVEWEPSTRYSRRADTGHPEAVHRDGAWLFFDEACALAWHSTRSTQEAADLTEVDRTGDPDQLLDRAAAGLLGHAGHPRAPE